MFHLEFPLCQGSGETSPSGSPIDYSLTTGGEILPLSDLSGRNSALSGAKAVGIGGWEVNLQDLVNGDDPSFVESLFPDHVHEKPSTCELSMAQMADFGCRDSWANTPISLPPTPQGTAPSSPAELFLPQPSATPIFMVQQPATPPFQPNPLTPVSLASPGSNGNGEEAKLEEILSFLKSDGPPPVATPFQNTSIQMPLDNFTSSSSDDCSSVYSSLHSGPSTPQTPFSFPPSTVTTPVANSSQTYLTQTPAFPPEEFSLPQSPVMPLYQPAGQDVSEGKPSTNRKRQMSDSICPQPQRKRRFSSSSKKERKREQNKTAALRYRQKKKEEKNGVESRQQELEERNTLLKSTLSSLEAEVSYLKKLWDEIQKAKTEQMSQQS